MAERRSYEHYFRDALEFDFLLQQYPYDRETLQEILGLLVDTVCTKKDYIRIASDDRPRDVVTGLRSYPVRVGLPQRKYNGRPQH